MKRPCRGRAKGPSTAKGPPTQVGTGNPGLSHQGHAGVLLRATFPRLDSMLLPLGPTFSKCFPCSPLPRRQRQAPYPILALRSSWNPVYLLLPAIICCLHPLHNHVDCCPSPDDGVGSSRQDHSWGALPMPFSYAPTCHPQAAPPLRAQEMLR